MAKINIKTEGRSGKVQYIEGSFFKKNTCEFYWEFGGADTVAIIWFPKTDAEWDAVSQTPIASGKRVRVIRMILEVEEERTLSE